MSKTNSISVLIPARGRPDNLRRSVASLLDNAEHPDRVELLFGTDLDQPRAFDVVGERLGWKEWRTERLGYQMLHVYVNELAARSTGDFLLLWNDDSEVLTAGWDTLLRDGPLFSVQGLRRDTAKTTDWTVLAMGRPIYDAVGHFALNPYNDAYLSHVAFYSGTGVVRDDVAFHHHCLIDQTSREQGDAGIRRFHDPDEVAMRVADIGEILEAPGYASRFDGFDVRWRGVEGLSLPNYQYVVDGRVREANVAVCTRKVA